MKILALDVGSRRIGVAIGDTLLGIALARDFIPHDAHAVDTLTTLISAERIERVLMGRPLALEGNDTEQTLNIDGFAATLAAGIAVPIEFVDERFTSILAHANLRAAEIKTKHHRPLVDSESARILLQTYFDKIDEGV